MPAPPLKPRAGAEHPGCCHSRGKHQALWARTLSPFDTRGVFLSGMPWLALLMPRVSLPFSPLQAARRWLERLWVWSKPGSPLNALRSDALDILARLASLGENHRRVVGHSIRLFVERLAECPQDIFHVLAVYCVHTVGFPPAAGTSRSILLRDSRVKPPCGALPAAGATIVPSPLAPPSLITRLGKIKNEAAARLGLFVRSRSRVPAGGRAAAAVLTQPPVGRGAAPTLLPLAEIDLGGVGHVNTFGSLAEVQRWHHTRHRIAPAHCSSRSVYC